MKIDLWGDSTHEQKVTLPACIDDFDLNISDVTFEREFRVECTIYRDVDIARIEVRVVAPAEISCARCLVSFHSDIIGEFEIVARHMKKGEVLPEVDAEDDGEADEGNLIFVPFGENSIDIEERVRDVVLLTIPIKPLCTEACKGLCHICGKNFNEGACGCEDESTDARWNGLSKIL